MQSEKKQLEQTSGVDHMLYKRVEDPKDADACAWVFKNKSDFVPYYFKFPALAPDELRVKILYSGLCHSDSSTGRNEWEPCDYPVCTGHEVIGEVTMVGSDVSRFSVGDKVFVGPIRNCCNECEQCKRGDDNLCCNMDNLDRFLYGRYFGGYATHIQQPAHHIIKMPEGMDERTAAPLICAGVTCLVPMQRHIKEKGAKIGVIGIGGLGHLAIQYGKALGCEVTAFTTSEDKRAECKMLGADDVVVVPKDLKILADYMESLDYLINTLYVIDMPILEAYLLTLKSGGLMIQVGLPPRKQPMKMSWHSLVFRQIAIVGSLCGSINDFKETIKFSHKHNIKVITEEYSFEDFPKALNRLENERPHFRCVVNVKDFTDRHFPTK
jgi:D-arabinose 1-dehydrogenase-like Zn-dependent alcohol dehydrogenase